MKKFSILIEAIENIDPKKDHRWVPDGDGQWFLPHFLDIKNNSYSGYWFTRKQCIEESHFHSGISFGVMFYGKMQLMIREKEYEIAEEENFFVPPNTPHIARLIPSDKGFLTFGTIVGTTTYNNEISDVKSYYELVHNHYLKHGLSEVSVKSGLDQIEGGW